MLTALWEYYPIPRSDLTLPSELAAGEFALWGRASILNACSGWFLFQPFEIIICLSQIQI
jgi:hypothetical protein